MADTTAKNTRLDGVKPTKIRRYLTPDEAGKLVDAAGRTAFPERNRLLVLMMYRHGLRVSEATGLRWLDIDLKRRTLHIHRLKGGKDAVHTLQRNEVEALDHLRGDSPFVFVSRRGDALSADMTNDWTTLFSRKTHKQWREAGCPPEAKRLDDRAWWKTDDLSGIVT